MYTPRQRAALAVLASLLLWAACGKPEGEEPPEDMGVVSAEDMAAGEPDMADAEDMAAAEDMAEAPAEDMSGEEPEDMGPAEQDMLARVAMLETPPDACGDCHLDHFDEWEGSMHAYASQDPIFVAMLDKGIEETEGALDQFCIQCHSPVASKLGSTPVELVDGRHTMPLDRSKATIHGGVVCTTCHATESVEATLNAQFTLTDEPKLFGPTGSEAAQSAHRMEKSDLLTSSLVCGSCHNVVNPKGALLENTFSEWYAGPFNSGGSEDKSCQDCHMPAYEGEIVPGTPATIHRHTFVGVDVALIEDFPDKEEQARLVEELLQSVAELDVRRVEDQEDKLAIRVTVKNENNGHALPSGSTADRQVWVHLQVHDEEGRLVYESGMFDAQGDLMDRVTGHSLTPQGDPDLLMFGSLLFDEEGNHVTFPWQASRSQDFLIQPKQTAWREYRISPEELGDAQTLMVTAVLNYRTFPPFLIRELKEEGYLEEDAVPTLVPIVEMERKTITISR